MNIREITNQPNFDFDRRLLRHLQIRQMIPAISRILSGLINNRGF